MASYDLNGSSGVVSLVKVLRAAKQRFPATFPDQRASPPGIVDRSLIPIDSPPYSYAGSPHPDMAAPTFDRSHLAMTPRGQLALSSPRADEQAAAATSPPIHIPSVTPAEVTQRFAPIRTLFEGVLKALPADVAVAAADAVAAVDADAAAAAHASESALAVARAYNANILAAQQAVQRQESARAAEAKVADALRGVAVTAEQLLQRADTVDSEVAAFSFAVADAVNALQRERVTLASKAAACLRRAHAQLEAAATAASQLRREREDADDALEAKAEELRLAAAERLSTVAAAATAVAAEREQLQRLRREEVASAEQAFAGERAIIAAQRSEQAVAAASLAEREKAVQALQRAVEQEMARAKETTAAAERSAEAILQRAEREVGDREREVQAARALMQQERQHLREVEAQSLSARSQIEAELAQRRAAFDAELRQKELMVEQRVRECEIAAEQHAKERAQVREEVIVKKAETERAVAAAEERLAEIRRSVAEHEDAMRKERASIAEKTAALSTMEAQFKGRVEAAEAKLAAKEAELEKQRREQGPSGGVAADSKGSPGPASPTTARNKWQRAHNKLTPLLRLRDHSHSTRRVRTRSLRTLTTFLGKQKVAALRNVGMEPDVAENATKDPITADVSVLDPVLQQAYASIADALTDLRSRGCPSDEGSARDVTDSEADMDVGSDTPAHLKETCGRADALRRSVRRLRRVLLGESVSCSGPSECAVAAASKFTTAAGDSAAEGNESPSGHGRSVTFTNRTLSQFRFGDESGAAGANPSAGGPDAWKPRRMSILKKDNTAPNDVFSFTGSLRSKARGGSGGGGVGLSSDSNASGDGIEDVADAPAAFGGGGPQGSSHFGITSPLGGRRNSIGVATESAPQPISIPSRLRASSRIDALTKAANEGEEFGKTNDFAGASFGRPPRGGGASADADAGDSATRISSRPASAGGPAGASVPPAASPTSLGVPGASASADAGGVDGANEVRKRLAERRLSRAVTLVQPTTGSLFETPDERKEGESPTATSPGTATTAPLTRAEGGGSVPAAPAASSPTASATAKASSSVVSPTPVSPSAGTIAADNNDARKARLAALRQRSSTTASGKGSSTAPARGAADGSPRSPGGEAVTSPGSVSSVADRKARLAELRARRGK